LPETRTAEAIGAAFCPENHPGDKRYQTFFGGVQVACDGSNINNLFQWADQVSLVQGRQTRRAGLEIGRSQTNWSSSGLSIRQQIPRTLRWRITDRGKQIMAASLCLRDAAFSEIFRKNTAA
jgi:hypothetical protein